VPTDLQPLAKKHGFDFNKFDTKLVDSIKSYSDQGQIYYLPYNTLAFALMYNKDIFDKFGVPYPKDNMTWDEAIELGKKLTRTEAGVNYIGLRPPGALNRVPERMPSQYCANKSPAEYQTAVFSTMGAPAIWYISAKDLAPRFSYD
jgi:ABC-type glycerol-3-phosphate transport system substrate-binding protein